MRTVPAVRPIHAVLVTAVALLVTALPAVSSAAPSGLTHVTQDRCRSGRVVLTFDDGPDPVVTPRLVRLLRALDVPAAFFMVGERVAAHPDVARAVADAGFEVGNHTWDHPDLTTLGRREVRRQLTRTDRALRAAGVVPSAGVRPPYGAADTRVRRLLDRLGVATEYWTVDSEDWTGLSPRRLVRRVVTGVEERGRAGSVVLHHDGAADATGTLRAVPREVRRLQAAGFCFVPLAEADPGAS